MNDFEIQVYSVIDKELGHLSKESDSAIDFDIYTPVGQQALEIIEKYELISFRVPGSRSSIADITIFGKKVIESGGIKSYLNSLNEKVVQKETKEILEIEKLRYDLILLKNQLNDYASNKWRAKWAFIIAVIAILFQLIPYIKYLICYWVR